MDKKYFAKYTKIFFAVIWFAYAVSYVGRKNFSTCISDMASDGIFTTAFAGTLVTGFFAAYGVGQFINGFLGDRLHPKYMMSIGLLGSGLTNASMGFCQSGAASLIIWCLNGYFCAMLWAPVVRCMSEFMLDEYHRFAVHISLTIPIGCMASYGISSLFLKITSWRGVFFVCGGLLVLSAIIVFLAMSLLSGYLKRVTEANKGVSEKKTESTSEKHRVSLLSVMLSTGLLFTIVGILFNGILKDGVTDWTPTYLKDIFNADSSFVSLVTVILPIINIFGAYTAHFIFRKCKNEMKTSAILFCVSVISLCGLLLFGKYSIILSALFIAVSTSSMLGVNTMYLTYIPMNFSAIGRSASITGFLDACSYIAAAASGVTIGFISEKFGWSVTVISWIMLAVIGVVISFFGINAWKKGKEKISRL